jgi:hypothetical protein
MVPVPCATDGYPERNRAALDRKIRQTFEDIEAARKDGDDRMVSALRTQIAYFKAARANNDGHPFHGMQAASLARTEPSL